MKKGQFILSVLVANHAGVLTRVSGLFSRRNYNIDSLNVAVTEDPLFSRMTIIARGDQTVREQITKQLSKLHDVKKIELLTPENRLRRAPAYKNKGNKEDKRRNSGIGKHFQRQGSGLQY